MTPISVGPWRRRRPARTLRRGACPGYVTNWDCHLSLNVKQSLSRTFQSGLSIKVTTKSSIVRQCQITRSRDLVRIFEKEKF